VESPADQGPLCWKMPCDQLKTTWIPQKAIYSGGRKTAFAQCILITERNFFEISG